MGFDHGNNRGARCCCVNIVARSVERRSFRSVMVPGTMYTNSKIIHPRPQMQMQDISSTKIHVNPDIVIYPENPSS